MSEENKELEIKETVVASEEKGTEAVIAETPAQFENTSVKAIANMKVNVTDDDAAKEQTKMSRKEKKALAKEIKERHRQFHISNVEIIKNYRSYSESEKKHYRYIFGRRVVDTVWPIFRFIILFGLGFVVLYPILYMISSSIRPQLEMSDPSIMWIPKTFTLSNFQDVWYAIDYPNLVMQTFLVNIICSVLQVVTCSITGYGFARFKFKGKGLLFGLVVLQIIVPTQVILLPQFSQFKDFDIFGIISIFNGGVGLNLTDTPIALYMMAFFCNGIRAGLFIFLFRQFFRGLPKELEDAAYLDGCGPFSTFLRIMIPNARTSYLTVFIFSLVWYWNDSYVTGMFFTSSSTTVALQVQNIAKQISAWLNGGVQQGVDSDYIVWIQAACLMSIIPIVLIYLFLQKYFIEGIERSGITGT